MCISTDHDMVRSKIVLKLVKRLKVVLLKIRFLLAALFVSSTQEETSIQSTRTTKYSKITRIF